MSELRFHPGRLAQVAFVVEDIEEAIVTHSRELKLGGWSLFKNFRFDELLYRGQPRPLEMHAAICFSGEMMYELIQPIGDGPSVYRDTIDSRGYGFHHFGYMVEALDDVVADYESRGHVLAQYSETANGIRAAYMDAGPAVPGMVELLEISQGATETFAPIYAASLAWDGKSPAITRYGD